jgi:hypothetical protein
MSWCTLTLIETRFHANSLIVWVSWRIMYVHLDVDEIVAVGNVILVYLRNLSDL